MQLAQKAVKVKVVMSLVGEYVTATQGRTFREEGRIDDVKRI